jgi:hypothetical protein
LKETFAFEKKETEEQMTKIKGKMANERPARTQIRSHCEYDELEKCQRLFNNFSTSFISAMELRETRGRNH